MNIYLSREQVRRVDQLAVSQYGLTGLVLMENAGRGAAEVIRARYPDAGVATICCGTGNNGGDGCVIARHLHNSGWNVAVMLAGEAGRMMPDARANFGIVEAMGIGPAIASSVDSQQSFLSQSTGKAVMVDAVLGTGFSGIVRPATAALLEGLNRTSRRALVAIDVPSGLDCDTGQPGGVAVRADLTITFVAQKLGFRSAEASRFVGEVEVVDIGAPQVLISEVAASGVAGQGEAK